MFTGLITWLQTLTTALEPLTAPFVSWITANLTENEAIHQMKRCKMYCRHNGLSGAAMLTQVELCFPSETPAMQAAIVVELTQELANVKK